MSADTTQPDKGHLGSILLTRGPLLWNGCIRFEAETVAMLEVTPELYDEWGQPAEVSVWVFAGDLLNPVGTSANNTITEAVMFWPPDTEPSDA